MQTKPQLSFITLLMLISFASVNAVLFTPALPQLAISFAISVESAQQTLTWFLVGYASGQLIYGPLTNRFGKKPAMYGGVCLQILSSLLCVLAGKLHYYPLLVLGRFLLALGSGVGLKMTYTLVNETYEPKIASQKISYVMLAFAVTPGLSVALGGFLNQHYGWASCFYAGALYGLVLLLAVKRMPKIDQALNPHALRLQHLLSAYGRQFKNKQLFSAALLMGFSTCFIYVFAALAPFIAINLLGMSSSEYGFANILPACGLFLGSLVSANLAKHYPLHLSIRAGIGIATLGTFLMIGATFTGLSGLFSLFIPMIVIFFGLSLVVANSAVTALSQASDKSQGASVMSFINMSLATLAVLSLGLLPVNTVILPTVFFFLCCGMMVMYRVVTGVREEVGLDGMVGG